MNDEREKTQPKPSNVDPVKDKDRLVEGRYGTREMCDIWGPEMTFRNVMEVQVPGLETINELYPGRLPVPYIDALRTAIPLVNPDRIRELEEKGKHDVIAINTAWGEEAEKLCPSSSSLINFLRTSADNTETAKAKQCKDALYVLADSGENLRDILLEKSMEWIDELYMDQTHLLDALPSVAGRAFSFFAESLQSDLDFIRFVSDSSLYAKWGDATGNHHAAVAAGIDGMKLQREYANKLGLRSMIASAQTPAREFIYRIMSAVACTVGTVANLAEYVAIGRGNDRSVFIYRSPGKKGSSAMPHKDLRGGNPDVEEQAGSFLFKLGGDVSAIANSIVFKYGRDLKGSALDRMVLGTGFKIVDHTIRKHADIIYNLELDKESSLGRVNRTYSIVTSPCVMTYLVDPSKVENPMARKNAHDLLARCATQAYESGQNFCDVLLKEPEIVGRIPSHLLKELTDPTTYIGQSKEIVRAVFNEYHGKKTFGK